MTDRRHGRFEFYFGWRANGAFGLKFNFARPKEVPPKSPAEQAAPSEKNP